MPLPYPGMTFVPFDVLTAAEMNQMVANDEALADGSGFDQASIPGEALSTSSIYLGHATITSNFNTTSNTPVQVTGLSVNVTVPSGGRRLELSWGCASLLTSSGTCISTLWRGTVGSGTLVGQWNEDTDNSGGGRTVTDNPGAGSFTYNVGLATTAGTAIYGASAGQGASLIVKLM